MDGETHFSGGVQTENWLPRISKLVGKQSLNKQKHIKREQGQPLKWVAQQQQAEEISFLRIDLNIDILWRTDIQNQNMYS